MPKPLSNDLRQRLVEAIEDGFSCRAAAERYSVSASTAIRIAQRWRAEKSYSPRKFGGHKRHALAEHRQVVEKLLADKPDATLAELQAGLAKQKIKISTVGILRFLRHIGYSYKKNGARQRTGT